MSNFPQADSPTFRRLRSQALDHYGIELSYEDVRRMADRMSDPTRHFFKVRHLRMHDDQNGLWAVIWRSADDEDERVLAVVRNKSSRAPVDILPPDALEEHVATVRYMTRKAQTAFVRTRERMTGALGFSFFTLKEYAGLCEAILAGRSDPAGGPDLARIAFLRDGHADPLSLLVRFDPEDGLIEDVPEVSRPSDHVRAA